MKDVYGETENADVSLFMWCIQILSIRMAGNYSDLVLLFPDVLFPLGYPLSWLCVFTLSDSDCIISASINLTL